MTTKAPTLREQLLQQSTELARARESIADLKLAIEDRGWQRIGNQYSDVTGLDLDSLQTTSDTLRTWVVAGGIMKRLVELRGEYIYGGGVGFKNIPKQKLKFFEENQNNVDKLFSTGGLLEVNRAHGTDGMIVFLVHKSTHEIIRVPFDELLAPYIDADDRERLWYVRRSYTRITTAKPEGEKVDFFYPTTTCPPTQAAKKDVNLGAGEKVKINQDYTAVVWKVNGQTGWPLGIPDLFASLQWAEKYTGYLKNQDRFAEALASIAWQYKAATAEQAKKLAATLATKTVAGTSVNTNGVEAKPLPGNSDVSFTNGEPLAGQAAAAAGVPVDSVLAKSKTDTGQNLNADLVRMVSTRRMEATSFFKAMGTVLGAPDLDVVWPNIESENPFREAQMIIGANGTGLFDGDEIRGPLAQRLSIDIEDGSSAPDGYLLPNNSKSLPRKDIDTDGSGDGAVNGQGNDKLGVGKTTDGNAGNDARNKGEV